MAPLKYGAVFNRSKKIFVDKQRQYKTHTPNGANGGRDWLTSTTYAPLSDLRNLCAELDNYSVEVCGRRVIVTDANQGDLKH